MKANTSRIYGIVGGLALAATSLLSVGCQIDVAGQTLPSPYYISDDIYYAAPGPEFKLANEAEAMQRFQAEQELSE